MKILYFALFLLAAGLLFWAQNAIIRKLVYPIEQRYLHCRIIPVVFLVLLAATNVYTLSYPLEVLDQIINSYQLAPFFNLILPNRAYELVYMLLVHLGLNFAVTFLVAAAIGITKLIFCRRTDFVYIDDYLGIARLLHLPWMPANKLYEDQNGTPCLNGRGFTMGLWVKGLKWTVAILWILEILVVVVSILWGGDDWNDFLLIVTKNWYLLPMAAFLLLQQIQFFLEGVSEEEAGTFGSATITEIRDGSYIKSLLETYRHSFSRSDALLVSDISSTQAPRGEGLGGNDLGNQQLEDCAQPDVLKVITNQIQNCCSKQSPQYQNALVELLNGRSINICDQCEGEFLIFLCAYLNYHMSQGRTALMLCQDRKRADQLCKAVNREMQRLNNLYSIWNICTLEGAEVNSRMSMLICSVEDFLNHHIYEKRQDFVGDLFCTVFSDGVPLFSEDRLCVERLFGVLRSIDSIQQYIAFSEVDNDALRTAMEQAIKQEVQPFNNNTARHANAGIMVWRGESRCRLQQQLGIGNAMTPYMGTALPLALVAVKFEFPKVYVISHNAPGIFSYRDVMTMSARDIARYTGKNANLKSLIRYHLDEALQQQMLSVTIVHDSACNFLNTLSMWQKYGGSNGSLLHIVSPPYALREYFAANFHSMRLELKNNIFDALISSQLGTKISHMVVLLVALCDKGLTEEELMSKVREYQWDYENVDQLLQDCLKVVLTKEEIHSIYECFHFEEEKIFRENLSAFEVRTRVTLIDSTIRNRLHNLSGYATLVSKKDQHQPLPVLGGNIYNYCLRHQIIPVGGYLYQVHAISGGSVHAEQVLPQDLPEYFQISDFEFHDYRITDNCVDTGFLDLNLCTANVTRNIYGYLACSGGTNFHKDSSLLINNLGQPIHVEMEGINILELNIRRREFGGHAVEAMRLLAFLIKDFAKTLFPVTHQNLFAVFSDGADRELVSRVLSSGNNSTLDDMVCSLIPGLQNPPRTDPEYITLHLVEFSCIEFGMVQMLYNRYQNILLMIREYLSWYMGSSNTVRKDRDTVPPAASGASASAESGPPEPTPFDPPMPAPSPAPGVSGDVLPRYLHFGADAIPGVLVPQVLLDFCRKITPEEAEAIEPVQVSMDSSVPRCNFCERPSMFPDILSDGRKMCGHCKDHQLTQKDEIKSMFTETVRFMTDGYSIVLPKNLHVRFQSADAIRRATGEVSGGRVLGFYNSHNRQLWLEARGPRIAMQSTLIHELTHAWQFHDPDFSRNLPHVLRKYPKKDRARIRLLLLEGHAVFMEVDTMRRLHEDAYADRIHAISMQRSDEYGVGYRLLRDYILAQTDLGSYMTPFKAMNQLLDELQKGTVKIS